MTSPPAPGNKPDNIAEAIIGNVDLGRAETCDAEGDQGQEPEAGGRAIITYRRLTSTAGSYHREFDPTSIWPKGSRTRMQADLAQMILNG